MSAGAKAGLGIAAALAAAAAGAYYFYGSKSAAKNRKGLKSWAVKAKGDVMEKIEGLKNISKERYYEIVDQAVKKYRAVRTASPKELAALAIELKGHWDNIASQAAKLGPKKALPAKRKIKR